MKDCIYIFYNKLTLRYESVFSFATNSAMIATMQRGKFDRKTYEVCKIGTVDLSTGVAKYQAPERIDVPEAESDPLPVSDADKQ